MPTAKGGGLPTQKTLLNALTRLDAVRNYLRRDIALAKYAVAFEGVEFLLSDVRRSTRESDGWRSRARLTNDQVEDVIAAARTPVERGIVGLLLAGCRPPSELAYCQWDHFHEDENGNLWWQVQGRAVQLKGNITDESKQTKTKAVDYRQLSMSKRIRSLIEPLRGRSKYVVGTADGIMQPSQVSKVTNEVLARAKIGGQGVSPYSFRHTVADEVERLFGREMRDLVLHGKRGNKTGDKHYSHAERERRCAELMVNGKPYGEAMAWSGCAIPAGLRAGVDEE